MKSFLASVFCLFATSCFACDPPSYSMCGQGSSYKAQPTTTRYTPYSSATPSSQTQTPSNQLPPAKQPEIGEIVPMLETTSTSKAQWIVVKMTDGRMYRAAIVNGYMPAIDIGNMTSHYKYKIPYTAGYQQEVAQFGYLSYKRSSPELAAHYQKLVAPNSGPTYFVSK